MIENFPSMALKNVFKGVMFVCRTEGVNSYLRDKISRSGFELNINLLKKNFRIP